MVVSGKYYLGKWVLVSSCIVPPEAILSLSSSSCSSRCRRAPLDRLLPLSFSCRPSFFRVLALPAVVPAGLGVGVRVRVQGWG